MASFPGETSVEDYLQDDYGPIQRFFPNDHTAPHVSPIGADCYSISKQLQGGVLATSWQLDRRWPDEGKIQWLLDIASLSYAPGRRGVTDKIIAFPEGLTVQTAEAIIPGILDIPNEGIAVGSCDMTKDELELSDDDIRKVITYLRRQLSLVKHDEPLLPSEDVIEIFRHGALAVYEKLGFKIGDLEKMESGGSVADTLEKQSAWSDLAHSIMSITRQELKNLFLNTTWDPVEVGQYTFEALYPRRSAFSIETVQEISDHRVQGELGLEKGSVLFSVQSGSGLIGRMAARNYPLAVHLLDPRSEEGRKFLQSQIIATNFAYANRLRFLALMRDIMMDIKDIPIDLELVTDRSHNALDCLIRETTKEPVLLHRHGTVRCEPAQAYPMGHPFVRIGMPFRLGLGSGKSSALMRMDISSQKTHNTAPVYDACQQPYGPSQTLNWRLIPQDSDKISHSLRDMIEMLGSNNIAELLGYIKPLAVFKP